MLQETFEIRMGADGTGQLFDLSVLWYVKRESFGIVPDGHIDHIAVHIVSGHDGDSLGLQQRRDAPRVHNMQTSRDILCSQHWQQ